jgi:hypothetical protein
MRRPSTLLLAVVVPALLAIGGPAFADKLTFTDATGDGTRGARLDVTEVTLRSRDHVLAIDVSFAKVSRGDLIVFLHARGTTGKYRVVSEYRPSENPPQRTFVLSPRGPVACQGLRSTWNRETNKARVKVPSRCLYEGDYGAVRTKVLTEIGPDADLAPNNASGEGFPWSEYAARG